MESYLAFGVVSAVMLIITIIFYVYKNWLALRKNAIYIKMLWIALFAVLTDVIVGVLDRYHYLSAYFSLIDDISAVLMSICLMALYVHILLYDMAVTKRMRLVRTAWFRSFIGIVVVVSIISIFLPFTKYADFGLREGSSARGNLLQVSVLAVCLLIGIVTILRNKEGLSRREFAVLLLTQALLVAGIGVQLVLNARNLASYYTLTCVLICYYILLHKLDQFRSFTSSCFDRNGFQYVLLERAYYKENFACLGICINNIESITNYCNEEEIARLHRLFGKLLREQCGRHNVYHIHTFEYMIMLNGNESAEKKHKQLESVIPSYFRINGKNVSLICGFYTLEFADAGYDTTEFNRTITSMRKLTFDYLNRENLLYYQGDNQTEIQNELEALRVVHNCVAKRRFQYILLPIQSLADKNEQRCEVVLQEKLRSGIAISQERIWELATETGYIREVGHITFETMCRAAWENGMLEQKDVIFHVNLLSSQLANTTLAEEYVQILKSHSIEGRRVCIELTIDRSVDYDKLMESFKVLQNYGITLLLDQFGVTVCNLKNVLNMSFEHVKINHYMVGNFCDGKSGQLTYMVRMLEAQGWNIYLDGIDNLEQLEQLGDLKIDYIQGLAVCPERAKNSQAIESALAEIEIKRKVAENLPADGGFETEWGGAS